MPADAIAAGRSTFRAFVDLGGRMDSWRTQQLGSHDPPVFQIDRVPPVQRLPFRMPVAAPHSDAGSETGAATPPTQQANLPGVRLCWRDSGGDGIPVVLLHANTGTSASWGPQFAAFTAAGYRVIAFDRRGWGGSIADPASGPQPGSVSEDLASLVDHLKLPKFHLLGVAGGGFVSLDYASWQQDRLRSLVVAASTGSFSEPEMQRLTENIAIPGFKELPETFREIGPSFRALYPERVAAWLAAEEVAKQPGAPAQPLRTPNTFAKIAQIKLPMMSITASADLLAPPSLMARWLRHVPQAEIVPIADAGHSVPMEQPEQFNAAVLDFWRRH